MNNANNQDKDNVQNYSPVIPVLYQVSYDDKDPEGQSDDHHNQCNDNDPEANSDDKHNQSASDLLESSLQGK